MENLHERINAIEWHHQIDLGNGLVTPGDDNSPLKLSALHLPHVLTGLRVLDVGAWDGFFSFACEKLGADVIAADHYCWGGTAFSKDGFDLAKSCLRSKVYARYIKVEEISPESMDGFFDIVLFLGVLYHAPDPLGYLRRIRSVTKKGGFAVIETHVDLLEIDRPALAYYPAGALGGDGSNFFGPNEAAVIGMCSDAGFSRTEVVERAMLGPTRMVFHAYA